MDTLLCLRIILITLSSISLVLQVIGLVGHGWFGFSFVVKSNGQTMSQSMHGGLLYFSPLKVCIDDDSGSSCRTPEQMTSQERRSFQATNKILSQSVMIQRYLVITGLTSSCCGLIVLLVYLFIFKKHIKHRCSGISSTVFWIFAALPEYIAIGVQIFANLNMKNSINIMALTEGEIGMHVKAEFITPWALIFLGMGASFAVITGIIVAVTTCKKPINKTVILYSKLPDGHTDKVQLLGQDILDDE